MWKIEGRDAYKWFQFNFVVGLDPYLESIQFTNNPESSEMVAIA